MFDTLDSQELGSLVHKLIGANRAIVREYGADSDMNAELISIYDDVAPLAEAHGLVFE